MRAAGRATGSAAEAFGVELEFRDSAAESITVHTQLASSFALVSVAVLQDSQDELLLEFANCFGISNAASIHLHYESFQLIFHDASLRYEFVMALNYFGCCLCYRCVLADAPALYAAVSIRPRSAA
jgi:hypothetical protein